MKTIIMVEWLDLPDRPRLAAPVMANDLEAIARAVRQGEAVGRERNAAWAIQSDVSIDELRDALALLAPKN